MAVLAVDCGGTNLTAARWDGAVGERSTVPAPGHVDEIPKVVAELMREDLEGWDAIGVGVAGLVDHRSGTVVWSPHASGSGAPVADELRAEFDVPVVVDNDANMAALAEGRAGAGAGHRTSLCVTVGTGIGGGLCVEGRVERGRGFAGEIGHIPYDPAGRRCACGKTGCWETAASGSALDRAAVEIATSDPVGAVAAAAGGRSPTGRHVAAAAADGDGLALAAIERVGRALGRGLAGMVAVLDPDVIVIGGSVGAIGEALLAPARSGLAEWLEGADHRRPTPVVAARFGADAGLVGAGLAATEVES